MQKFKEHKLGVAIIFSLMFLTPFMENTRGIFIPIFKDDF
ncbi:MAG: MFS transporter, partial [Clostridium sp.]|nr:MFS transporter [Clostridium sp.]